MKEQVHQHGQYLFQNQQQLHEHGQHAISDQQKRRNLKQKCEQDNQLRGDTKFTALISVATPPTEFNEPKGACVIYSAARRSCHG